MPTNQKKINIYEKRLFSRTGLKDQFLDFLNDEHDEAFSSVMQEQSGTLSSNKIGLTGPANDQFSLDITNADRVIVGGGQIIDLSLLNGADLTSAINFENNNLDTYYVGIKFMEIEVDMELNPRTGDPEYAALLQTYGELGIPNSLDDTFGSNLRVWINNITEDNVDHSGRTCRVWLVDPVSGSDSVAFFTGTVAYDVPTTANYVDIPYSGADGPLGQDTSSNPPSTTASDYKICIQGTTWKKNTDLSADSDYAFVGTITGNGPAATPTSFDISGQVNVFLISLDRAYDGAVGSGDGRAVTVDAGAVEFNTLTGDADDMVATFRINRKGDTQDIGACLQAIYETDNGSGLLALKPLEHATGNLIYDNPIDTVAGDEITRTGSVDWTASGLDRDGDFCWVHGTPNDDGLYLINTFVSATNLELRNLDNSTPVFAGGDSGYATILRVRFGASAPAFTSRVGFNGNVVAGDNEVTTSPALKIFPRSSNTGLAIYNNTEGSPVLRTWTDPSGRIKTDYHMIIEPLANQVGFDLTAAGLPTGFRLDQDRLGRVYDPHSKEAAVFDPYGRIAVPHVLEDNFTYRSSKWSTDPGLDQYSEDTVGVGSGTAIINSDPGGLVEFTTDANDNDYAQITGEAIFKLQSSLSGINKPMQLRMWSRFGYESGTTLTDRQDQVGVRLIVAGSVLIAIEFDTDQNTDFRLVISDGAFTKRSDATGVTPAANTIYQAFFAIINTNTVRFWISGMTAADDVTIAGAGSSEPEPFTDAVWNANIGPYAKTQTLSAAARSGFLLDYWRVQTEAALVA